MIEYIKDLGITTFKNAVYKYKTKKIEILGDGTFYNTDVEITTGVFEGGYNFINILLGVDDEWSTAFTMNFIKEKLFDTTKIADYIGEQFVHKIQLSFMDGMDDYDSYYFTPSYSNSLIVLEGFLKILGPLELISTEENDMQLKDFAPFKSFYQLKENILETVKDLDDDDEVKESMEIFMEFKGEEFRTELFFDSRLIYEDETDQRLAELIEDVMYDSFNEDEVLLDEE